MMFTQLVLTLAVWYASDNYRTKKVWTHKELTAYLDMLKIVHASLKGVTESKNKSSIAHRILHELLTVLGDRIDEIENLLRLHPLVLGNLNN